MVLEIPTIAAPSFFVLLLGYAEGKRGCGGATRWSPRIGAPFAMSPCRSRVPDGGETKVDLLHSLLAHSVLGLGQGPPRQAGLRNS